MVHKQNDTVPQQSLAPDTHPLWNRNSPLNNYTLNGLRKDFLKYDWELTRARSINTWTQARRQGGGVRGGGGAKKVRLMGL